METYTNRGQYLESSADPLQQRSTYLESGDYLSWGLDDDAYFLVMQYDGNVCIYRGTDPSHNKGPVWCALSTAPGPGEYYLVMTYDGNLRAFQGHHPSGSPIWETGTGGHDGADTYTLGTIIVDPESEGGGYWAVAVWKGKHNPNVVELLFDIYWKIKLEDVI